MRILKGLSSRLLPCGCVAGVYETYDGDVVTIIDAPGPSCRENGHADGNTIPTPASAGERPQGIAAQD
jgi:hypothetical protein